MNILLYVHTIIIFEDIRNAEVDIAGWIEAVMSIISIVLGVITIVIGKRIITSKRANAKYGFYINFLIFIERFQKTLADFPGITAFLVKEEIRETYLKGHIDADVADQVIPLLTELCDDFIKFISTSDNNVVPEHWKNSAFSREEEWKEWLEKTKYLVLFAQKCKLLKQGINPYFSLEQVNQYKNDLKEFENALSYMNSVLQQAIIYPPTKAKIERDYKKNQKQKKSENSNNKT